MNGQTSFLQVIGWALLHSLWQMAVLWILYLSITGLIPRIRSSVKATLASGMLIAGFGWFIFTLVSLSVSAKAGTGDLFPTAFSASGDFTTVLQSVLPSFSVIYLLLLIIPLSHFIKNYRYVTIIRKYGLTKPEAQWRLFVKQAVGRIGIKRNVEVWISDFVSSPVTVGFLKPVILLPLAAVNNLTTQQLEAVLLHELAHIRRHDYLINLFVSIVRTILYFNPFVKLLSKQVEKEREKGCDELVLQFQYSSYEYAAALLALEKSAHEYKAMVLAASGHSYDLLQRVELIMGIKRKKIFSGRRLAAVVTGVTIVLLFNAIAFFQNNKADKKPLLANSPTANFLPVSVAAETPANITQRSAGHFAGKAVTFSDPASTEYPSPEETVIPDENENPDIISAASKINEMVPELDEYQAEQVKKALDESRKVLKNIEWKEVERSIAEVFTEKEKKELQVVYQKQIDKYDWKRLENNLKAAYDKVDWENVNLQLSNAINNIRVDSLKRVYNEAICKLNDSRKEISLNLQGLLDTALNTKVLDEARLELKRSLDKLKAMKAKKTVHL